MPPAPAVRSLALLSPAGVGGCPLPGLACLALGAQSTVPGGSSLLPGSDRAPWELPPLLLLLARGLCAQLGLSRSAPPPSYQCAVCARGWGGGTLSWCRALSAGGVLVGCAGGLPPVPLLRASGARCWLGGSTPPSPPLQPLALSAGCRSGGSSSSSYLRALALRARAGGPLPVLVAPLVGGSLTGPLGLASA